MLLALSEIKHNKLKFGLIVLSLTLIVFLLLMLSAMGSGLILGMTGAVGALNADLLVFQDGSQFNLQRSNLAISIEDKIEDIDGVDRVVPFGQLIAITKGGKSTFDSSLMLTAINPMVNPPVIEGRKLKKDDMYNVVVDQNLLRDGVDFGGQVTIKPINKKLKIVGITTGRRMSMMPAIYITEKAWQKIKFEIIVKTSTGRAALPNQKLQFVGAYLVKAKKGENLEELKDRIKSKIDDLEIATKSRAMDKYPGMAPMKMVVVALEGLSFLIGAVLVGIFFYIITLQKVSQVGMLKALGASSRYIFINLVVQVSLLTLMAILIGTALAYLAVQGIPPSVAMSLESQGVLMGAIGVFIMSFIGTLFSLRHIVKIDPIIAIGQSD